MNPVLDSYEILVGSTRYIFKDIPLEKSALGKWSLTYGIIHKMMASVASQILSKPDGKLTADELEYIAKVAGLSLADMAELAQQEKGSLKDGGKMKFSDIEKFTQGPSYKVNVSWMHLARWIKSMEDDYGIDLSPDYQRDHVWTEIQEIRYVEYVLRGGKSGLDIFFNCSAWRKSGDGKVELVDGKQRLKAVMRFLNNEIKAFGLFYNEFEDKLLSSDAGFVIHVNDLQTRKEVMQWYVDMNAGGTVHSDAEIARVKAMIDSVM